MSEHTAENAVNENTETTEATTEQATETATESGKDWQADAEKWKALARKHETASKANADKARHFDEMTEAQKSELQKAEDRAAKAERQAAERDADLARLKAAVKHNLTEDDLELLGTHGTPDEIEERAERLAARIKAAEAHKPKPDFGGGDRGGDVGSAKGQLSRDDMKRMTPDEIDTAHREGRFSDLVKNT